MKTVSIIIPVYNSEQTLSKCLDSVLSSTYMDIEVLLLDDGSKDNSLSICREYAENDSRIRVFHHDNHGVSYTRNRGLDEATGDYIMFVDSDDTISPTWVEAYAEAIETSEADMVIGGMTEIDDNNIFQRELPFCGKISNDKIFEMLSECKFPELGYVPNKIYKTSVVKNKNIRFNPVMTVQEDLDFFVSYVQNCKEILIIKETGYFYDYVENKRTTSFLDLLHNKIKIFECANDCADCSVLINEIYGHVYHYLRNLSCDESFVDESKKLDELRLKRFLKLRNKKDEKQFVFLMVCRHNYCFLKCYFFIRKSVKVSKNK